MFIFTEGCCNAAATALPGEVAAAVAALRAGCVALAALRGVVVPVAAVGLNVRVLLSLQQPTFQKFTNINSALSAAWFAFHLKHVAICVVSSEIMKCRLLN